MGYTPTSGANLSHSVSGLECVSMNFKLGANAVTAMIYRMLMKHNRYINKDQAYKWCIHIHLFLWPQNTRQSTPRVRTHLSILRDRKKIFQKFRGWHGAQEETPCLMGETIVCGVPIMCFRGICITSRSLVRYGSTGGESGWTRLGVG